MYALNFAGTGRVTERRELGKKNDKNDIWCRVVKLAVGDQAAELIATPEQYASVQEGDMVRVSGRIGADLNGVGLFVETLQQLSEEELLEARLAELRKAKEQPKPTK